VREFVLANARYWITEFHLDGLRLDATQSIEDRSTPNILAEIVSEVRESAGGRKTFIVGENEPQHSHLIRPQAEGGYGLDALWNDDFHHSAMVALTGRREAYYTDYFGTAPEFVAAASRGFLYQGQWYSWQMQPRGSSTRGLPASAFVAFIQNHDQIANSLAGRRVHELASPGRYRAMTALLLLGPWTPMLFQGQEFAASSPFVYFADHYAELADAVRNGRVEFLAQFPSLAGAAAALIPDPGDEATFAQCKLNHAERASHAVASALHRSLIALRRDDPAFHDRRRFDVEAAVLTPEAFVLRFSARADDHDRPTMIDRLLVVNLGVERSLPVAPEPLLSPFPARRWLAIWSSDEPAFGGSGVSELMRMDGWYLPAESATVLAQPPHRR
jgi:maltooligosyltrehalose trehalohydrolase